MYRYEPERKPLPGWLPRRLRCLGNECLDRAAYVGHAKFSYTYLAAQAALEQAARRIEELERQIKT